MKRKLTTILCADGVRFGAHMEADEAEAFTRLRRHRDMMGELFARHDGRQVNTWGDAVIAEFQSVVEAVRCAVEIQDAVALENAGLESPRRMQFRIGVNLGDVMIDGDDLYGDGVNVAARLQEMAEPGGVVVSGAVHDFAHKQLVVGFDFIGEQTVKNIAEPVRSYTVRMAGRNADEPDAPSEKIRLSDEDLFSKTGRRADRILAWVLAQPKKVRRSAAMIAVFFCINLLFTGIANPWFIFPSLPFALIIFLHVRRTRRAGLEAAER
ncbi:adenylate/guanylate cyclase domain-containing protein [Pikeienuella piscinae]|uniref:adenylate/guanylate cyclase domain-containing protein n=1 Tax=Pikeienuella piscinae TaxID=2748098 RepID=UPI001BAA659B|nr:adenylate/guanylate cyclase domain-containing protein [Pikeienuella piscinae]